MKCIFSFFKINRLLLEGGYEIDVVFTSRLKRAIRSVWLLLQELNEVYLPVFKSWRLNERMYGGKIHTYYTYAYIYIYILVIHYYNYYENFFSLYMTTIS